MSLYLAAAATVGALGYVYEKIATHLDVRNPPGEMIDVGGHKLHVQLEGKASKGVPLVVIEAGINDSSHNWQLVRKKLADRTQVLTYDRAGYAWSENGPRPRTFEKISSELDTLLKVKGISQQSFILVGHSLGGIIIRDYHNRCSDEVRANIKGMVFVDTMHPDGPLPKMDSRWMHVAKLGYYCSCLGIVRLFMKCVKIPFSPTHPEWTIDKQRTYNKFHFTAKSIGTCFDEGAALERNIEALKQRKSLNNIPITVIQRDPGISMRPWESTEKIKEEREDLETITAMLSKESNKSTTCFAKGSGHLIHITKPEIISDEVTKIMDQIMKA